LAESVGAQVGAQALRPYGFTTKDTKIIVSLSVVCGASRLRHSVGAQCLRPQTSTQTQCSRGRKHCAPTDLPQRHKGHEDIRHSLSFPRMRESTFFTTETQTSFCRGAMLAPPTQHTNTMQQRAQALRPYGFTTETQRTRRKSSTHPLPTYKYIYTDHASPFFIPNYIPN